MSRRYERFWPTRRHKKHARRWKVARPNGGSGEKNTSFQGERIARELIRERGEQA